MHTIWQAAWHKLSKTPNFPIGKDKKKLDQGSILILHYKIKTFPFSILLLTMTLSAFASTSSLCGDNVTLSQFFAASKLPGAITSDNGSTFVSVKLQYLWTRILSKLSPGHLICFKECLG